MKKDPKKKKAKIEKQDKVLIATFIGMIALVAILGIIALNLDNIYKDDSKDLTIPILEEHSDSELSVEATTLEAGDIQEYILVVANYKEKELLKSDVEYDLEITSTENLKVEVYKNNSSDNLLTENDSVIEDNKLTSKKKIEDIYKIVIKAKNNTKKTDKITIKIHS